MITIGTPAHSNYTVTALPVTPGRTGRRSFFVDSSGVIRYRWYGSASSADSPVE